MAEPGDGDPTDGLPHRLMVGRARRIHYPGSPWCLDCHARNPCSSAYLIDALAECERARDAQQSSLDAATVSRLLFQAREVIEMTCVLSEARIGRGDRFLRRLLTEIDAFRAAQGWSPHGYGYGPGDESPPGKAADDG